MSNAALSRCDASLSIAETTIGMYFFGWASCSIPSRMPSSVLTL
jgi:hypothetical protein